MRLRHLGHSCLLVEVADRTILIDPGSWSSDFEDLSGLDAIVVTHQHADHLDRALFAVLVRSNPDATIFTYPQSAALSADDCLTVTSLAEGVIQSGAVALSAHATSPPLHNSRVPQVPHRRLDPGHPVLAPPPAAAATSNPAPATWQESERHDFLALANVSGRHLCSSHRGGPASFLRMMSLKTI
mgnify:CR=1 FL=1